MGGGLMQLVAYGAQDVYLTGNPQITFFKVVYRRHTNFATESIENYYNGAASFGRKVTCTISRNGDLITKVYAKITLPEVVYTGDFVNFGYVQFAWVRRVGHAIFYSIELEIGGSRIDKQYSEWLDIWYELTHKTGQEVGYAKMIGDVPELTELSSLSFDNPNNNVLKPQYTLYVPFQFYFCRNNGLALPLIALQYHEVKFNVHFRPVNELYVATDAFINSNSANNLEMQESLLLVDYVYLDTEERRRMAQVSHEYLIEQLQFTGEESIKGNADKYKLAFNHPSKELYWITKLGNYHGHKFQVYVPYDWEVARCEAAKKLLLGQYDLNDFGFFNDVEVSAGETSYLDAQKREYIVVDPASPAQEPRYVFDTSQVAADFDGSLFIGVLSPHQPLLMRSKDVDLRSKVDGVIRIYADTENSGYYYPEVEKVTRNDLTMYDLSIPISVFVADNRTDYIRRFDPTVWQHTNYGLLINWTLNPVSEVLLQLNGHDRFSRRASPYFNLVQPYQCHTNIPRDGLNVYSFALNPEEHQPSGTCNFSRIDTAQLNLWFSAFGGSYGDVFTANDNRVWIYTVNYNVLRVMSGMGGLAYSN
jgi:hypothetical protein